ncbi:hypothetical protein [Amycolatopsis sulphurea]|uniref:hypothetical protein n=1 Tax=Amycolatopsis sulphurea TaxID=76022 RepID=UPI000BF8153E|nr:hypothetical protein [Amycolatopsis sulphurea]
MVARFERLRFACCRAQSIEMAGAVDDDAAATALSADHGSSINFADTLRWTAVWVRSRIGGFAGASHYKWFAAAGQVPGETLGWGVPQPSVLRCAARESSRRP